VHLLQKISRSEWLGKDFNAVDRFAKVEAVVIQQAAGHQNAHPRPLGPQITRRVVPRHPVNVRANDQQIWLALAQPVHRRPKIPNRQHYIAIGFKSFRQDSSDQRLGTK